MWLLLILITGAGAVLRFANILPYKFYPDAYQNLLVAESISKYNSVVHTLGENGYLFPPFFMWSRPVYPLLINMVNSFFGNYVLSAQIVSLFSGIITIPVSYFMVSSVFSSKKAGFYASILVAFSFNHVVWSGLIMTETTGILVVTVLLLLLFKNLKSETLFDFKDLITGFLFAVAVFTRYEYMILIIPILYIVVVTSPKPFYKLLTIVLGFISTSAIIFSLLFPVSGTVELFWEQSAKFVKIGFVAFTVSVLLFLGYVKSSGIRKLFSKYKLIIFIAFIPLILYYPGFREFIKDDFLIVSAVTLGMFQMSKSKNLSQVGFFCLVSTLLMLIVYYNLNPKMIRYSTHTLPFLLIPGGYFLSMMSGKKIIGTFIFLAFLQLTNSFVGIKNWNMGDWTKPTYEETSARQLAPYLREGQVIVAAFPEPYYFFTGKTVVGVTNETPFADFESIDDQTEIIVVNDLAMKNLFPAFYDLVEKQLDDYKIGQFFTNRNYRYKTGVSKEKMPVFIYRIKLWDLKMVLNKNRTTLILRTDNVSF
jgi:hypothetical protein